MIKSNQKKQKTIKNKNKKKKIMKATIINTAKELKDFISKNRKNIIKINGVQFGKMYPMMEVTNKHASYYDIESQEHKSLHAPFTIEYNGSVSVSFESLIEEIKKLGYSVSVKNSGGHKVVIWSNKTHFASIPFVENSVDDLKRVCQRLEETIFNVENNHPSRHDIIGKSKDELLNRRRYVVLAIAVWKENINDATPDRVAYNINYFEVELKIIDKELARF